MSGFAGIRVSERLVREARAGSLRAHEQLFRLFSAPVYTLALRMVGHPAKAEDVLQDTFIEVMRSIGRFRSEAALATWIRQIAVSKSLMLLRSAWERRGKSLEFETVEHTVRRIDDAMDLETALAALEPASRAVVWLHDVEGYTHSEIAALTGYSVSFSKSRLSRARRGLRAMLTPVPGLELAETVAESC